MKKLLAALIFVALLMLSGCGRASAQTTSCNTHKEDSGDTVTVCEGDGYTSSMRCNTNGCTSNTTKDPEREDDIAALCRIGIERFCTRLQYRIEGQKESSRKVNPESEAALVAGRARISQKADEKRLELCSKGVFEKDYCDKLKARLASAKPPAPSK